MEAQQKRDNRCKKAVEKEVNKQLKLYKKNVKQLDNRPKRETKGKKATATENKEKKRERKERKSKPRQK